MPRLTDQEYLDRRKVVFREWLLHHGALFARLPLSEQHALHVYFATVQDLQRPELLAFRARITRERPALAQEAGRAFRDLELLRAGETSGRIQAHAASLTQPVRIGQSRLKQRTLTVLPLAWPTPDVRRLAWVLAEFAQTPEGEAMIAELERKSVH